MLGVLTIDGVKIDKDFVGESLKVDTLELMLQTLDKALMSSTGTDIWIHTVGQYRNSVQNFKMEHSMQTQKVRYWLSGVLFNDRMLRMINLKLNMQNKKGHALIMCQAWHDGQVRKYTGKPYWTHPVEVMELVSTVPHTEAMLCAALLHDVVEDTECTLELISNPMGDHITSLVEMLTDVSKPEDGNRAERRAIDREHTALASAEAKTIKLADVIVNLRDVTDHDQEFARVYVLEKEQLLQVLLEGDPVLFEQACELVRSIKVELGINNE